MRRLPSAVPSLSQLSFPFLALLTACLFVIAIPLSAQQTPALVTQPVDNSVRTTLTGNVHPLTRVGIDRGEAPANMVLHRMLLVLKRSDQQETSLRRLIENQQYKKSPSYHQWLTPEQFGASFGPSDADIAAVTNWLQASGFQIAQVSKGRTVIEFSGTAGQLKQAFGTAIHQFEVNGEQHWANVNDPSIPTALAPVVAGFDSLHNFLKKAHNVRVGTYSENTKHVTSPAPGFTTANNLECPSGFGTCYAVSPFDFAAIYDLLPLWTAATPINGTGQTIAIVGRTDIDPNDAPTLWSLFGLGVNGVPMPTLNRIFNGPNPGIVSSGDEAEADIDTQWSGAVAPGATIDFVVSESTETDDGVDLSALYIVDNNIAPVMSTSFGLCESILGSGGVGFWGAVWEQAAAQGISALVSTGDNSSAGCDSPDAPAQNGLNVSGLASSPWNIAVGGTDFNQFKKEATYWNSTNDATTQKSAKGPIPETTWNDSCANPLFQFLQGGTTNAETNCNNTNFAGFLDSTGGSGGASLAWLKPSWQTGTGVPNDNSRDLPDVSLFASNGFLNSFYVICQSDQTASGCDLNNLEGFGGTSVSTPAFAGIMALVNQKWGLQGNANFVLYNLAKNQPTAFHDVPSGSTIAVPCVKGSSNCTTTVGTDKYGVLSGYGTTTGYDLATGLGSVDGANLVNNWNMATFTPTTTTLTLTVPSGTTHGSAVNVTVSVTPNPGSVTNTKTEDVALLVSPGTPGKPGIDFASLTNGTVTFPTNLLPGGTYKVIAHYAGDGTFGGSYSAPSANITINPEASLVFMGSTPGLVVGQNQTTGADIYGNTVVYGTGAFDQYLLRADVQNSAGKFCTTISQGEIACPTGHITFNGDTNPVPYSATLNLNSEGYAEDQSIQLAGGSHTLVANYSGDASYNPSTTTATVTVTPNTTTAISNVSAPTTALTSQNFTVTATVTTTTSFGVAPTGAVKFFANGTLLGTAATTPTNGNINTGVLASLAATLTTSEASANTYAITATYAGDANYAAVTTSNSVNIVVSPPPTPFTWTNTGSTTGTVKSGQSATYNFSAAPSAALTAPIVFSCSGLPDATTACNFNPAQIAAGTTAATPVQLTITTTGPNPVAGSVRAQRVGEKRSPWLPLALPLAGIVAVGFARRKISKCTAIVGLCVSLALLGILLACGGGGSSPPPPIGVSVGQGTPSSVFPNNTGWPTQTAQFTATVSNTTNTAVTWSVTTANGGTIDANGLYTAPSIATGLPTSVTIKATAAADGTTFGTAQETLKAATVPGTYNNIMVTGTEGTIVHSDAVTLVAQ